MAQNAAEKLHNLDVEIYLRHLAHLDERSLAANMNRKNREDVAAEKGRAQEGRQALLLERHTTEQLKQFDDLIKNCDWALEKLNREYIQHSDDTKPLLHLRDSAKACLDAHRIPIFTGVRSILPLATSLRAPAESTFKLLKFKKAAAAPDPIAAFETAKKQRAEITREIGRVESLPVDSEEVAAEWCKVIDEQATRFTNATPCNTLPDRNIGGLDLIRDTVAVKDGQIGLGVLLPIICALCGDALKQHVRTVANGIKDGITSVARAEKLKELADRKIAADHSLEVAARRIESAGARVIRPGDLDPRIFLAHEL